MPEEYYRLLACKSGYYWAFRCLGGLQSCAKGHLYVHYRYNAQQRTEELENAMTAAETAYAQNPCTATLTPWLHSHREYELHLLDLTKKRMLYVTQKTFEHGNKAGRLLTYLTRSDRTPISIPRILISQDKISDIPQEITEAFLS